MCSRCCCKGKRLKVAQGLDMAATLADELQQSRLRTVPRTDDVVEWRERPHADVVLAVAVAAWQGERPCPSFVAVLHPGTPVRPRWRVPWGW